MDILDEAGAIFMASQDSDEGFNVFLNQRECGYIEFCLTLMSRSLEVALEELEDNEEAHERALDMTAKAMIVDDSINRKFASAIIEQIVMPKVRKSLDSMPEA
jgi:predicted nucleic acid-binding protein